MPYMESMMRLQEELLLAEFEHDFLFIKGESLVQRARNNAVRAFLKTQYERMLFIDSDLEFTPEDVGKLWALDESVCCGSYPMKRIGIKTTAWKDGKLVDLDDFDGPVSVDYAGTGFLMVKKPVFMDMMDRFPFRSHMEGKADGNFDEREKSFSWFDPHVTEGEFCEDRVYLSEDYAFSKDVQEMGLNIILEPSIKLTHYGMYGYGSISKD